MIAASLRQPRPDISACFEENLPRIQQVVRYYLRRVPHRHRQEAISDAVSLVWVYFIRLWTAGKNPMRFLSVVARYGALHTKAGRSIDTCTPLGEIMTHVKSSRRGNSANVSPPPKRSPAWKLAVIADKGESPADTAAFRIDFEEWTCGLPARDRRMVFELASGATTSDVAKHFEISAGRVSQLRNELRENWERFQGVSQTA